MTVAFVPSSISPRWRKVGVDTGRTLIAVVGALVVFGAFMVSKGVSPFSAYSSMWTSTFTNWSSFSEVLIKASPIILAALAVAVPARAGLVNVGGEGQIVAGAIAAAGMGLFLGQDATGWSSLLLMGAAGALGGAAWAAIAAALRVLAGINEAVSTLLLNYVAIDLLLFLIYDPWKDSAGVGQPTSRPLGEQQHLPLLSGGLSRLHAGILVAVVAAGVAWFVLKRTTLGFQLRAVGGNPEAARRAGLRTGALIAIAMVMGGALAGLGGFVQFAGVEYTLRPGFAFGYGYIAFLASWLARHSPVKVALSAVLLSAIAIGGDSLQIDSGLPAASVNVLMAVVLLAVFGWSRRRSAAVAS